MRFSVFTVVTPDLDPETAVEVLSRLGYQGVEWRVAEPPPSDAATDFWKGNRATLDVKRIVEMAEDVKRLTEAAGLRIPVLSTYLGARSIEPVRACFRAAAVMGASAVRVSVPRYTGEQCYSDLFEEAVADYSKVEAAARETGVKAVFEIHMGNICPSASLAHRFASHFDPRHVGAIYDPGNMVKEGYENWQMGLELLGPYLAHVHVKNARLDLVNIGDDGQAVWQYSGCPLHVGQVSWKQVLRALKGVGYDGWLSIEDFSTVQPTEAKLDKDLQYLKSLLVSLEREQKNG